ncbi:hypothetical protein YPPY14_2320, partial [Yersinia pestis PY-14]
MLLTEVSFHNF